MRVPRKKIPRRPAPWTFEFLITLLDVAPPVWRRIRVPERYSFWDLHVAIQDAMGWLDYHLHSFRMTRGARRTRKEFGIPDDDDRWPGMPVTLADWEVPIAAWFTSPGHEALYTYDFGDDWRHVVRLEAVAPAERGVKVPRCVDGARACPPEDVGGPFGYDGFLEALRDPRHEEHKSYLEWVGGSFDPERFDASKVKFWDPGTRWRKAFGGASSRAAPMRPP